MFNLRPDLLHAPDGPRHVTANAAGFHIAWLVAQPPEVQQAILDGLMVHEQAALRYHWPAWARPEQLEPAGE